MVAQHEVTVFRHLIGEPDVAFAHGQRVHIGFVQRYAVYRDYAVHVHIDHITGLPDDALEQQLVLPVKPAQLAVFNVVGFYQQDNVFIINVGYMLSPET